MFLAYPTLLEFEGYLTYDVCVLGERFYPSRCLSVRRHLPSQKQIFIMICVRYIATNCFHICLERC